MNPSNEIINFDKSINRNNCSTIRHYKSYTKPTAIKISKKFQKVVKNRGGSNFNNKENSVENGKNILPQYYNLIDYLLLNDSMFSEFLKKRSKENLSELIDLYHKNWSAKNSPENCRDGYFLISEIDEIKEFLCFYYRILFFKITNYLPPSIYNLNHLMKEKLFKLVRFDQNEKNLINKKTFGFNGVNVIYSSNSKNFIISSVNSKRENFYKKNFIRIDQFNKNGKYLNEYYSQNIYYRQLKYPVTIFKFPLFKEPYFRRMGVKEWPGTSRFIFYDNPASWIGRQVIRKGMNKKKILLSSFRILGKYYDYKTNKVCLKKWRYRRNLFKKIKFHNLTHFQKRNFPKFKKLRRRKFILYRYSIFKKRRYYQPYRFVKRVSKYLKLYSTPGRRSKTKMSALGTRLSYFSNLNICFGKQPKNLSLIRRSDTNYFRFLYRNSKLVSKRKIHIAKKIVSNVTKIFVKLHIKEIEGEKGNTFFSKLNYQVKKFFRGLWNWIKKFFTKYLPRFRTITAQLQMGSSIFSDYFCNNNKWPELIFYGTADEQAEMKIGITAKSSPIPNNVNKINESRKYISYIGDKNLDVVFSASNIIGIRSDISKTIEITKKSSAFPNYIYYRKKMAFPNYIKSSKKIILKPKPKSKLELQADLLKALMKALQEKIENRPRSLKDAIIDKLEVFFGFTADSNLLVKKRNPINYRHTNIKLSKNFPDRRNLPNYKEKLFNLVVSEELITKIFINQFVIKLRNKNFINQVLINSRDKNFSKIISLLIKKETNIFHTSKILNITYYKIYSKLLLNERNRLINNKKYNYKYNLLIPIYDYLFKFYFFEHSYKWHKKELQSNYFITEKLARHENYFFTSDDFLENDFLDHRICKEKDLRYFNRRYISIKLDQKNNPLFGLYRNYIKRDKKNSFIFDFYKEGKKKLPVYSYDNKGNFFYKRLKKKYITKRIKSYPIKEILKGIKVKKARPFNFFDFLTLKRIQLFKMVEKLKRLRRMRFSRLFRRRKKIKTILTPYKRLKIKIKAYKNIRKIREHVYLRKIRRNRKKIKKIRKYNRLPKGRKRNFIQRRRRTYIYHSLPIFYNSNFVRGRGSKRFNIPSLKSNCKYPQINEYGNIIHIYPYPSINPNKIISFPCPYLDENNNVIREKKSYNWSLFYPYYYPKTKKVNFITPQEYWLKQHVWIKKYLSIKEDCKVINRFPVLEKQLFEGNIEKKYYRDKYLSKLLIDKFIEPNKKEISQEFISTHYLLNSKFLENYRGDKPKYYQRRSMRLNKKYYKNEPREKYIITLRYILRKAWKFRYAFIQILIVIRQIILFHIIDFVVAVYFRLRRIHRKLKFKINKYLTNIKGKINSFKDKIKRFKKFK